MFYFNWIITYQERKFYFFNYIISNFDTFFSYGHIRIKNYSNSYYDNQYRIVHTNFDQKEKWKKENIEKMASNGSSDLITIFPETAFGMYNVETQIGLSDT